MAVHESKVSLETLRYCRELVADKVRLRKLRYRHRKCKQYADDLYAVEARLAELDAEIAAKEAEKDA